MGCDYYKSCILKIILKNNNTLQDFLENKKGYFPDYNGDVSDSDCEFNSEKFLLNEKIRHPDKILFENGIWIKPDYEYKFNKYLEKINIDDILVIKKIYNFNKR